MNAFISAFFDRYKVFIIIAEIVMCFVGGFICGWKLAKPQVITNTVMSNSLRTITNIEYKLNTIYVPIRGDTERYTNLYVDSTNILSTAIILTDQIAALNDYAYGFRLIAGGGITRGNIPVSIGGGFTWDTWIVTATVGIGTSIEIASLQVYYKF